MDRQADPFTLGRDVPDPAPTAYESGDPSSWGEDVAPARWKGEGRDETNIPTFRPDTFTDADFGDHRYQNKGASVLDDVIAEEDEEEDKKASRRAAEDDEDEKEASRRAAEEEDDEKEKEASRQASNKRFAYQMKRATVAVAIAEGMLPKASEKIIVAASQELMFLPNESLANLRRIQRHAAALLAKTAGEIPEQFKKKDDDEKKDEKKDEKAGKKAEKCEEKDEKEASAPIADFDFEEPKSFQDESMDSLFDPLPPAPAVDFGNGDPDGFGEGDISFADTDFAEGSLDLDMPEMGMDEGSVEADPELEALFDDPARFTNAGALTASQRTAAARAQQPAKPAAPRTAARGVQRLGGAPAPAAQAENAVSKMSALWQSAPDVSDVFGVPSSVNAR